MCVCVCVCAQQMEPKRGSCEPEVVVFFFFFLFRLLLLLGFSLFFKFLLLFHPPTSAFPHLCACLQPAAKATFAVTLVIERHLTALSNMPESRVEHTKDGEKKRVTFMPTPVMSSYLLAMCVGEFDFIQVSK